MSQFQVIIGRHVSLALPSVGAIGIPAKVDTGAYRSAIHSSNVRVVKRKDGTQVLKATLLGHPVCPEAYDVEFTQFEKVVVTNSFGDQEARYEVNLRVKVGPKVATTQFTLANRSRNFFPILIGRKLLRRRFIVDVSRPGQLNKSLTKGKGKFKGDLPEDFAD